MSGSGGHKHRRVRRRRKAAQKVEKAQANILRVRARFDRRGQSWEPETDGVQLAALNHAARRLLAESAHLHL